MPDADGFTPHRMISFGFGIILVGDRRHLAVERHVRGSRSARRRRARQPRRAEAAPQLCVEVVLSQQPVRAAVGIGRIDAAAVPCAFARCIDRQSARARWSHVDALEAALRPCVRLRTAGVEQAIRAVDTLAELSDLGADEPPPVTGFAGSVERDDLALPHW